MSAPFELSPSLHSHSAVSPLPQNHQQPTPLPPLPPDQSSQSPLAHSHRPAPLAEQASSSVQSTLPPSTSESERLGQQQTSSDVERCCCHPPSLVADAFSAQHPLLQAFAYFLVGGGSGQQVPWFHGLVHPTCRRIRQQASFQTECLHCTTCRSQSRTINELRYTHIHAFLLRLVPHTNIEG